MKIAFYAPLKAPGHPAPSGDRTLARLFFAALRRAGETRGWGVEIASRYRSFDGTGDAERQARLRDLGIGLGERLMRRYRQRPAGERPRLWFTYHLYHKAPDWLGPAVAERLGIPYVVAEASHAAKQAGGAWGLGHDAAALAIRRADAILALNRDDVPGIVEIMGDPSRVVVFPPFLGPRGRSPGGELPASPTSGAGGSFVSLRTPAASETADVRPAAFRPRPAVRAEEPGAPGRGRIDPAAARAAAGRRFGAPADVPWLLCVAMMRGGRKLASFELLAHALARLVALRWHLVLAGDGPVRCEVQAAMANRLPAGRATFTGRVEGEALAGLYAGSDIFVWPAVGEPLGMAMLEAQGHGLPVVAARTRGVPELVRDGDTGLLVREGDPAAFADAIGDLLRSPERRRRMGLAARVRAAREHGFEAASDRIGALVDALVRGRAQGRPPAPALAEAGAP